MPEPIAPAAAMPPAASAARLSGRAWGALLVLCGALFLDGLDVSMTSVALPSIQTDLGLSTTFLQWVVSAYVLGYGGFLLLGGRAADLLGRRRVFLVSLAVFLAASALGGLATDGWLLVATRFVKGVSAAFTGPAGFAIITTGFAEGPARNRALAVYTATGASGFSLGLVISGVLTQAGWRWVFFLPAVIALATLAAAVLLVPADGDAVRPARRSFDLFGAVSLTGAMLLLVFTVVEAPVAGLASGRTLGSLAGAAAVLAAFVVRERRAAAPLVRLGVLRSGSLVRANLAAMSLFGGWVGFLFVATIYLQQLRGWSPLQTGLAVFPAGVVVAALAPRMAPLIARFGLGRLMLAGMASSVAAYALFLRIGPDSAYVAGILPTVLLGGLGFALAYTPINVAASMSVRREEQGLAGGLVQTSFQLGGALVLAAVTAVDSAYTGPGGSPAALLAGFHPAIAVSLAAAVLGLAATAFPRRAAS
jgi:MFS family permease